MFNQIKTPSLVYAVFSKIGAEKNELEGSKSKSKSESFGRIATILRKKSSKDKHNSHQEIGSKNKVSPFLSSEYVWRFIESEAELRKIKDAKVGDIRFILDGTEDQPRFRVSVYSQPFEPNATKRPHPKWQIYQIPFDDIKNKYKSHPDNILKAFAAVLNLNFDLILTKVISKDIFKEMAELKKLDKENYNEFLDSIIRTDIYFITLVTALINRNPRVHIAVIAIFDEMWLVNDILNRIFRNDSYRKYISLISYGAENKVKLIQSNNAEIVKRKGLIAVYSTSLCDNDAGDLKSAENAGCHHVFRVNDSDNAHLCSIANTYLTSSPVTLMNWDNRSHDYWLQEINRYLIQARKKHEHDAKSVSIEHESLPRRGLLNLYVYVDDSKGNNNSLRTGTIGSSNDSYENYDELSSAEFSFGSGRSPAIFVGEKEEESITREELEVAFAIAGANAPKKNKGKSLARK